MNERNWVWSEQQGSPILRGWLKERAAQLNVAAWWPNECRKYPGTTIVTDSVTSNGLTEFITGLGGKHFRYRRGYKNVIGQGVKLNQQGVRTELMMETR